MAKRKLPPHEKKRGMVKFEQWEKTQKKKKKCEHMLSALPNSDERRERNRSKSSSEKEAIKKGGDLKCSPSAAMAAEKGGEQHYYP